MFLRRTSTILSAVLLTASATAGATAEATVSEGLLDRGVQAAIGAFGTLRGWATFGAGSVEAANAWKAFKAQDKDAFKKLEELARQGNADAQNYMGHIYAADADRANRDANANTAARWFAMAAQKGHPAAIYNLSLLQFAGRGVERDEARAMDAMATVKTQIPSAAVHLALYHYKRKEFGIAWENAQFAASRGEGMGAYIAGRMLHEGTASGGQIDKVRRYLAEATKFYISDAAWILATTYDEDKITPDSIMLSRAYRLIAVGIGKSGSMQTPTILAGLSTDEAKRAQNHAENWFKRFKKPAPRSYMATIPEVPAVTPSMIY
jgi:TPR repeat protein